MYSMIGFEWTVAKFLWYLFFMYFTLLYFTFYGMMAVGLTPNETIAVITSSAFYNVWNLFSGYLIPRPVSNSPLGLVNFTLTIAYRPQHFTGFLLHMTMSSNLLSLFFFFRNCLSGGGGTAGSAQSHGHSTDWLPPSSATSRIRWRTHRQARRWRSSSRITSASITTSCGLSQGCTSG